MPVKIIMPKLSGAMVKGRVGRWFKAEREEVEEGEPLFEVETEKVCEEIESPASGVLYKILAPEGSEVSVSEVIGVIAKPGEARHEVDRFIEAISMAAEEARVEGELADARGRETGEMIKASPIARRLAREQGIRLTNVRGTGPRGMISKKDVLEAIEMSRVGVVEPEIAEVVPLIGMRKVISERLTKSYQVAPHVTLTMEVDITRADRLYRELKSELKEKAVVKLSFLHVLIKAVATALRKHPILNSALTEEGIRIFEDIHIGLAVSTEKGLIVPSIHHADKKSLVEIALTAESLIQKAREDDLSVAEVSGGTFTVSNLGACGVGFFTPIINPPQSAILGVGRSGEKAIVIEGKIEVRRMLLLSLTFDHRVMDGVPAARFMQSLEEILQTPSLLSI